MPNDTAAKPKRFDVQVAVALTLIVQTVASLLAACVPVLAPDIAATRGWDVTVVALYPTVLYATAFLVSFRVPQLLKRLGGMGLSVACLAVTAVGLLCLLSPRLALTAGAPVAAGFASASMNPASSQVLGPRTTSRNAAFVMSIKQTGVPLGGVLAGLLVPVLVARSTWPGAVLVLFVAGIAMAVMLLPSVPWLDRASRSSWPAAYRPLAPVKHLLAMPNMLPILVAGFVFTGMQLCLRTFFTVYLVHNLGLSLVSAGLAFSVSQAAGIVGQIGWAAMSDRLLTARQVMVVIGMVMSAAAVLTATMTGNWPIYAVIAVAMAFGGSAAAFVPVVLGEVARQSPPGHVGALTSGVQLFLLAGALIGPLSFGAIASQFGFANAFLAAAGCIFAAAVMLAVRVRTGARDSKAPHSDAGANQGF
jgi:MFS family permease